MVLFKSPLVRWSLKFRSVRWSLKFRSVRWPLKRWVGVPLVCALVGGTWAGPAAAAGAAEEGRVVQVKHSLRGAIAPSATWSAVLTGSVVGPQDALKTGEDSGAELVFGSGARLTLGASTVWRYVVSEKGALGRVLAGRAKLSAPPIGMVALWAGDACISGTDAEAIVERSGGAWRVYGVSGRCWVRLPEGDHAREWPLAAGQMMTLTGGAPVLAALGRARAEDLQNAFVLAAPAVSVSAAPSVALAAELAPSRPSPDKWVATGLSTLLPGTGQLYAGEVPRGLTYLGLEGALLGTGFYAKAQGQDAWALGAVIALAALNVLAPLDAYLTTPGPVAPAAKP